MNGRSAINTDKYISYSEMPNLTYAFQFRATTHQNQGIWSKINNKAKFLKTTSVFAISHQAPIKSAL